jgi:hypothetical protein
MAYEGIDSELKNRMTAFGANPNALAQRYQQNGQLLDLLALQKLKKEKEEAKQSLAGQMQQNPPTIKKQREDELLQMTKDELVGQTGGILNQQKAKEDSNLRKVAARGMPRPKPRPKPQGGIGALQRGVPPQNPMMAMANRRGAPIQQRPNVNPMMMAMANRRGAPMQQRPVDPMAGGIPRLPTNNMRMASSGGIIGFSGTGPPGSVVPDATVESISANAATLKNDLQKDINTIMQNNDAYPDINSKQIAIDNLVTGFRDDYPNIDLTALDLQPTTTMHTPLNIDRATVQNLYGDLTGTDITKDLKELMEGMDTKNVLAAKDKLVEGGKKAISGETGKGIMKNIEDQRRSDWNFTMPTGGLESLSQGQKKLEKWQDEREAMYKEFTDPKAAAEQALMNRLEAIGGSGSLAEAGKFSRQAARKSEAARRKGMISGLAALEGREDKIDQTYQDKLKYITDLRAKIGDQGIEKGKIFKDLVVKGYDMLTKLNVQDQKNIIDTAGYLLEISMHKDDRNAKMGHDILMAMIADADNEAALQAAKTQMNASIRIAQAGEVTTRMIAEMQSDDKLQSQLYAFEKLKGDILLEVRTAFRKQLEADYKNLAKIKQDYDADSTEVEEMETKLKITEELIKQAIETHTAGMDATIKELKNTLAERKRKRAQTGR